MKKKVLNWILGSFGLLGFAMVLGGVIIAHGDYRLGVVVAISGLALLFLVVLVNYLFSRFLYRYRPPSLPLDKRWNKIKKVL